MIITGSRPRVVFSNCCIFIDSTVNKTKNQMDDRCENCDNILLWLCDHSLPYSHTPNLEMLSHLKKIVQCAMFNMSNINKMWPIQNGIGHGAKVYIFSGSPFIWKVIQIKKKQSKTTENTTLLFLGILRGNAASCRVRNRRCAQCVRNSDCSFGVCRANFCV